MILTDYQIATIDATLKVNKVTYDTNEGRKMVWNIVNLMTDSVKTAKLLETAYIDLQGLNLGI